MFRIFCRLVCTTPLRMATQARLPRALLSEDLVYTRVEDEDKLVITLYDATSEGRERALHFSRILHEPLRLTLARMVANVKLKRSMKKNKKKAASGDDVADAVPHIVLLTPDLGAVSPELPNGEAWQDGGVLKVDAVSYSVVCNRPVVVNMEMYSRPMVNFPVPLNMNLIGTSVAACQWLWYCSYRAKEDLDTALASGEQSCEDSLDRFNYDGRHWRRVSRNFVYSPSPDTEGCTLLVVCIPPNKGRPEVAISAEPVVVGTDRCPFEDRFAERLQNTTNFRIVQYNCLGDCYTGMEFTQRTLHAYCDVPFLIFEYRRMLLIRELMGYNADLFCLQEIDKHQFSRLFYPVLESLGFDGIHLPKGGDGIMEGEAIFWRKELFELVEKREFHLATELQENPLLAEFATSLAVCPVFLEEVMSRNTVLQVAVLTHTATGKELLVANTHLYFKPFRHHIRVAQVYIITKLLETIISETNVENYLLAGDFNSAPQYATHRLLARGHLPANCPDWYSGDMSDHCPDLELFHTLSLRSAAGYPAYTTVVGGFTASLDYIYISESLGVKSSSPLPPLEEIYKNTALPNQFFPSDHLPLIMELSWTPGDHIARPDPYCNERHVI